MFCSVKKCSRLPVEKWGIMITLCKKHEKKCFAQYTLDMINKKFIPFFDEEYDNKGHWYMSIGIFDELHKM